MSDTWILHIDDNVATRRLTCRRLQRAGYRVVETGTGADGLRLAREHPGLILLDLHLPDISGFELCRRIKRDPATEWIPVLHLSAEMVEAEHWVSALEGGADGYLTHPVDEGVLIATVRALLRAAKAEVSVRKAAREWKTTFNALSTGVCLLDAEGRLARMNRAAGEQPGQLLERVSSDGLLEQLRTGGERVTAELEAGHQWFSLVMDPIFDEAGGFAGAVAALTDITERMRMDRELKRSNAELEQFAYVASHDLQEPLRMVRSYLQLLARRYHGKLDQNADEFIGFAVDGAVRMKALIDDLLAYSRVGRRGNPFVPFETGRALDQALVNLKVAIETAGAEVARGDLPVVGGDERQFVQLFQNLVGNAVKFRGGRAPRVEVAAELAEGAWVFSVRDNGIGIRPEDREKVFEIFRRLHSSSEYAGTGLGLAISQRIVERHGGRIWVESEPGQGSSFRFTIPAASA